MKSSFSQLAAFAVAAAVGAGHARAVAQTLEVAASLAFTEGPTVAADGTLYFSDIVGERIMTLAPDGHVSVYREHSNVANGLLIDPQGRLIACEGAPLQFPGRSVAGTPRVTRTDLTSGAVEVLLDRYEGRPLVGPNDVTIDSHGRLYVTDMPGDAVYRIDGPGRATRILAAPDVSFPNGIQVSPDDSRLYVVQSNQGATGPRSILVFDLQADGTARNGRVHYNFFPGRSADGISIDTQGNLYASAGLVRLRASAETLDTRAGVYVISPQGALLSFTAIPEDLITNNAFGGPDMKTLYVTAGKSVFKIRTDVPGLPR